MQIIKYFLVLFIFTVAVSISIDERQKKHYTVIIDPSGDAHKIGRKIGDAYERGLTLQCAEKIKECIYTIDPSIKVIITRMPGDIIHDLQNASLANRLQADIYININFYHSEETKPTLSLYTFSYGNDFAPLQDELALYSYEQAYRVHKDTTKRISSLFKNALEQSSYESLYKVDGVYSLPIKPLIGIVIPALAIDIGIKSKEAYVTYADPLAHSIVHCLNAYTSSL